MATPTPRNLDVAGRVHRAVVVLLAIASSLASRAAAQANVPNLRGDWGLRSGTLAAPGVYVGPTYFYYNPDQIIDKNGNSINRASINQQAAGIFAVYASPKPIWGAHWGMYMALPWANASIEAPNVNLNTTWGFSDLYLQPVYLGWSFKRFDLTSGFGFFAPSGRFTSGATDNTGLGMWSYAFDVGSTVFLNPQKTWSVATLATLQLNSSVKDTDRRAGNIISLEGGAGYGIMKNIGVVGFVYSAQWKLTPDRNFPITLLPPFNDRDRYFGLGPEVTSPIPIKKFPMMLTLRYFFETGNRVATQGNVFFALLTWVHPFLATKPPC